MSWPKRVLSFAIFGASAYFAFWHASEEKFSDAHRLPRRPAAIPRFEGFSEIDSKNFVDASRRRLVAGLRAVTRDGAVGLQVGHFVLKTESGVSKLACQIYEHVEFEFEAEGMASGGSRPTLTVSGLCQVDRNLDETEPIWLPVRQILARKPEESEGQIRFENPSPVTVTFKNLPGFWPEHWVLANVRVFDKKHEQTISLDSQAIYKIAAKTPLIMRW